MGHKGRGEILDFFYFNICESPGNGGSESFYRIENSCFWKLGSTREISEISMEKSGKIDL